MVLVWLQTVSEDYQQMPKDVTSKLRVKWIFCTVNCYVKAKQGFSLTEIKSGHFVRATPPGHKLIKHSQPDKNSNGLCAFIRLSTVADSRLQIFSMHNWKSFYLFLNQNIHCGFSIEPSQWNGSIKCPKLMLKLLGKKIFTILHTKILFISISRYSRFSCDYELI